MAFNPVLRIELEKDPKNGVNRQVVSRLKQLDAKAKELREQGRDPRVDLAGEIADLKARAALGYQDYKKGLLETIDGARQEYEKKLDRDANKELARMQRAQLRINSLDNEQIKEMAQEFTSNPSDMDETEYRAIAGRLNQLDPALAKNFRETAHDQYIDRPYLKDESVGKLYHEYEDLEAVPANKIPIYGDGATIHANLTDLVDLDGELEQEVNF